MNLRSLRKALLFVGLTMGTVVQAFPYTLQDALARVGQTSVAHSARIAVDSARANLQKFEYAGDFTVSAAPQAKATTEYVVPFPEQTEIYGILAARLPVGLSDSAKLQVKIARATLETAQARLSQVMDSAYESVYGLYMQAWLTQEEQGVLKAELEAAQAYFTALEEQFRAGKVSLVDLTAAEEDLQNKEASASRGELSRRLSWLRLSTALGLPITTETPHLEADPMLSQSPSLPKPPELISSAFEQDVDLRDLSAVMTGIEEQMALLKRLDLSSSVQLSGGIADHSVSLSYSFDQPQLSASYTIPFYSMGTIPGNNSGSLTDTWNVGFSVSISLSGGKSTELETAALQTLREQDTARLDDRRNSLQLDIRSQYQEWLTSIEEVSRSQKVVTRIERNKAIVESRHKLGLASRYELLQADALLERAKFNVLAAESTLRVRFLGVANSAGYLQRVIQGFENGGNQ